MKSSELIAVATFWSPAHAQKAKGILAEAGIESMIRPDPADVDVSRSRITSGNFTGGWPGPAVVQLMVKAEDVDKAGAALHKRS
jgi:Putative prokaryotic signal transducing protein